METSKNGGKLVIIVLISIIFSFLNSCNGVGNMRSQEDFSIVSKKFEINDKYNDVTINFPQMYGMHDKEKEKTINEIIENDIKRILNHGTFFEGDAFHVNIDYEIKFISREFVSIFYKGSWGPIHPSTGLDNKILGTNIDLANAKIVTLEDLVIDSNSLYDFFINDKFNEITMWDGIGGNYPTEFIFGFNGEYLKKALTLNNMNDVNYFSETYVEWYTDGEHFIPVVSSGRYYYEYSINFEEIDTILYTEYLTMLQDRQEAGVNITGGGGQHLQ